MGTQSVEFTLLSNHLINDGRYMPKIIHQKTVEFEELLKEMEHDTALRKEDIRLAITRFLDSIRDNLIRGLKVETPLGVFRMSIRGSFSGLEEDFRPGAETTNHQIRVNFRPNKSFENEVISGVNFEKVLENNLRYPKVFSVRNISSPESGTCKPLEVLSFSGINLKINAAEEDEGVFWTNPQGEKTKTTVIVQNTNVCCMLQVPELPPETYLVSIAVRLKNHLLRTTTLEEPLVIS
jgi:nucleoid DNA-binding protein